MIPTRIHGILDYIVGVILIAAPWLLGFADNGAETWVPVVIGAGSIFYSLITDYELGLTAMLPMKAHLAIDVVMGLFLATSPWLLAYAGRVYLPHVIVGAFMVITSAVTRRTPAVGALDHRRNASPIRSTGTRH
jgi:hypothetical protein